MTFLTIVVIGFLLLEISNVFILFFMPDSRFVHGMGMFPAWEKSKAHPDIHNLMKYLVIWVAGSKLVLIGLLILVLVWGDARLLTFAGFALALSMLPFYVGLFPAMRTIDNADGVEPKGFSARLAFSITSLILALLIASIVAVTRS